ncbi:MAG: hypothetical protein VYA30_16125 [Myxococcota bacterium]|nr:hypothetical protein [Myxococcota bacterium]
MLRSLKFGTLVVLVSVSTFWSTHSFAAERVDVIDAADDDDPFDMRASVTYRRSLRRAKITREFNCAQGEFAGSASGQDPCPFAPPEGQSLNVKELRYERLIQEVVPEVRIGLYKDLELLIEAPVVLSNQQEIRFAGNGGNRNGVVITPENSTVAPANGADLFSVPPEGLPNRAGFGDMLFMLRYSPISQTRDPQRSTWTLEAGYRAPTGAMMEAGNTAVGRGVHEVILATSLSRRFRYVDPYARFEYVMPFAASGSRFKKYGAAQQYVGPGDRMKFELGTEISPYENPETGAKVYVDLGFSAMYQAEGRDYSELFDAIGMANTPCPDPTGPRTDSRGLPNQACFNPNSQSQAATGAHDGITTVEQFIAVRAHLGGGVYVSEHAKLSLNLSLAHETEHYLSNADVGRDLDGSGLVEARGQANFNPNEHNPTFSAAIDAPGRRLRVEEKTIFNVGVTLSLML